MTRDTAERARGCLVFNDPCHNDVNIPTTVKNISALLTQVQAEARLEEAKFWAHNWYGYDNLGLSGKALESHREQCRDCLRIAALAQALQPATGDK